MLWTPQSGRFHTHLLRQFYQYIWLNWFQDVMHFRLSGNYNMQVFFIDMKSPEKLDTHTQWYSGTFTLTFHFQFSGWIRNLDCFIIVSVLDLTMNALQVEVLRLSLIWEYLTHCRKELLKNWAIAVSWFHLKFWRAGQSPHLTRRISKWKRR